MGIVLGNADGIP
jgi:hypothetical protein